MAENDDQVWRAALEDYAARMTPADFQAFIARVRPPDDDDPLDPTIQRQRAVQASLRSKAAALLQIPADNGYFGPSELKGQTLDVTNQDHS